MKVLVLMGSPRKNGNTAALLQPFCAELQETGAEVETVWLHDLRIEPCVACRFCQEKPEGAACSRQDDAEALFQQVLAADLIVLATPIYSFYCTPPMKALLDRMVYAMNKFYGEYPKRSLWAGKPVVLLETCGYRPEKGCDLFEEGMRRYCKHSGLRYLGSHAERHLGYDTAFMDEGKAVRVREFAKKIWDQLIMQEDC